MRRIGKALLFHEGVARQPFHELRTIGGDHLRLRQMDMGIDEARADEMRAMVDKLCPRRQAGQQRGCLPTADDQALLHHQQAVSDEAMRRFTRLIRVILEPEKAAAQGDGSAHGAAG